VLYVWILEIEGMRTAHRLTLAGTVLVLGAALPLAAQDAPEPQGVIEQLQGKGVLADEDTAALRSWIEQQVQAVVADDPAGAAAAVQALRKSHTGTPAFQQAYVTACVEVIRPAYKRAKRDAAARLIAVLNTLNEAPTYTLLIEALGDQRVPVRAAAAIGLRSLQTKLVGAGGNAFADTIAALRDAGKREESPVTLQLIYRAMDYASSPDPRALANALLELLEARGGQYGARNVKAEGADRVGLQVADRLSGQLDDDGRRRLTIATAKMLDYAVRRYAGDLCKIDDKNSSPLQIALRDRMELFIQASEELLSKLTEPPTGDDFVTVTREMQDRAQEDKATYMRIQMNLWATLLRERFQLDLQVEPTEETEAAPPEP
jgi:hypothetical protein